MNQLYNQDQSVGLMSQLLQYRPDPVPDELARLLAGEYREEQKQREEYDRERRKSARAYAYPRTCDLLGQLERLLRFLNGNLDHGLPIGQEWEVFAMVYAKTEKELR